VLSVLSGWSAHIGFLRSLRANKIALRHWTIPPRGSDDRHPAIKSDAEPSKAIYIAVNWPSLRWSAIRYRRDPAGGCIDMRHNYIMQTSLRWSHYGARSSIRASEGHRTKIQGGFRSIRDDVTACIAQCGAPARIW
jgi:hypothetical protein